MRRAAFVVAMMVAALLALASPGWGAPRPSRAQQAEQVDFDGDGFADLAVGAPGEDVGSTDGAGAVNVLAGSAGGLVNGSLATQGNPEEGDAFGQAIAGGFFLHDFDNNGFFDLAVGAPIERVGSQQAAGAVSVFYASGGPGGMVTPGPAFLQGSGGVGGTAEAFDFFGAALE